MGLFWERGYYDVSVDELVNRTGLHRAAIYGQFGSRQRLFEATLRRYRETIVADFFAELEQPNAGLAEIRQFFLAISRTAARPEKRMGCLMINTTCEVSRNMRSVAHIVSRYLDELRALFRQACINARRAETFAARPTSSRSQTTFWVLSSDSGHSLVPRPRRRRYSTTFREC